MNAPQAPERRRSQPLRFERAEDQTPVHQNDRVERRPQVQVSDALDVRPIIIHDEELHRLEKTLRGPERVAVAGERHLAARQRTGARVEHTVGDEVFAGLRRAKVVRPAARAGVGRELLMRQPHDPPRLDVDLVDIGPGTGALGDRRSLEVVKQRVINPLAVERNHRVGDGSLASRDQDFLRAIRMQEHQVGAGVHEERAGNLGPVGPHLIAAPRCPHIDNVVVELDRLDRWRPVAARSSSRSASRPPRSRRFSLRPLTERGSRRSDR